MREKLLASLAPEERELFMDLLRKFVDINNEQSRAPLRKAEPKASGDRAPGRTARQRRG
jgi:hypothetical protein